MSSGYVNHDGARWARTSVAAAGNAVADLGRAAPCLACRRSIAPHAFATWGSAAGGMLSAVCPHCGCRLFVPVSYVEPSLGVAGPTGE
jgi:hypothetical protein